jgi:hypothetical protein
MRDIFAAIFEFDLEPPGVTATTTFFPPAKIYNPTEPGYEIHSDVEDDAGGSGIESVYLVYEYQLVITRTLAYRTQ